MAGKGIRLVTGGGALGTGKPIQGSTNSKNSKGGRTDSTNKKGGKTNSTNMRFGKGGGKD